MVFLFFVINVNLWDVFVDLFGWIVFYLWVFVIDWCDFWCVYCMVENMMFLLKLEVLSLEELEWVCGVFIDCGVKKIWLIGGEFLVWCDILILICLFGVKVKFGVFEEFMLMINGS